MQTEFEEKPRKADSSDEIDLSILIDKIQAAFQRLGNGIASFFSFLKRNFLLISIITIIGGAVGVLAHYLSKPYFTSSMTLVLSDIRNEFVEDQLVVLTELVDEDNFDVIAQYLEIEVKDAMQIKEMEFLNLDENRIDEDSVLVGSPFKIELTLYDNKAFETMEPAIVNYLENNRYFSKQKRIRQRQIESLIEKYKREITSIDSIKTSVSSPRGPVNGFVYGEPLDPTKLYQESVSMYQEQVDLEAELDRLDNIEIVNGFTPRLKPTGPKLLKFLLIGGAVAFLIGIIIALNLENKKRSRLAL